MRTLLTLTLALSLSTLGGCASKKKAPQNPTNTATESAPAGGASSDSNEETNMAAPDKGDESSAKSSDPCEGGE